MILYLTFDLPDIIHCLISLTNHLLLNNLEIPNLHQSLIFLTFKNIYFDQVHAKFFHKTCMSEDNEMNAKIIRENLRVKCMIITFN